jgi:choline-sulfatase
MRVGRLLSLAILAGGCSARPPAGPPPAARHLVLVTIDTLRADRLSCYGSRTVATPHLDALARDGALAEDASVQVPLTRPSHVSLMTGLYPAEHGVRDNVSPSLSPSVPVLAEVLEKAGFATAGFVSSVVLSRQSGLARGFSTYSDRFLVEADDARFLDQIQKRGDVPTGEAIAWLEGHRSGRLFVWLHLYDPHDPYEPPEPYASRYEGRPYDGEVAWSDELLGRLDGALERLSLRGDTLLVVTSDHGEGLGEHGEEVHGYFVYETTLHVPLLVRGPGVPAGTRLATTFRSVDLFPTVLDLLGVPLSPRERVSGRSLAAAFRGAKAPPGETTYAESLTPLLHYGWSDLRALRDGRFKYVQAPRPELYDLKEDPGETRNLVASQAARAEALRAALAGRLEAERHAEPEGPATSGVPPELLEKLGALGYVGTGGGSPESRGADPKDKLGEFKETSRQVRQALVRLREGDDEGAADIFQALLARGIEGFEIHYYLGRALLGRKRHREAARHFEEAIRRQPAYGAAYKALADCREAAGDPSAALATLKEGEATAPKDVSLRQAEGRLLRRLGRTGEARRAYEEALVVAPRDALSRVELGELLRDAGELERAIALMREAVALDPEPATYWNALGMVLGGAGRMGEAEGAFREAVRRDAKDAQYAYNLGLALLRQGRGAEARPYLETALRLEPRFRAARERLAELGGRP